MSTREFLLMPNAEAAEIIPAAPGSACVDPRRATLQAGIGGIISDRLLDPGVMMYPGATLGTAMTLMGTIPDLTPELAVDLACDYEISRGDIPTFHDDDSDHDIGCGHGAKAESDEYRDAYELEGSDVRRAWNRLYTLGRNGMPILRPVLAGPHRERGVLEVHSLDNTVVADEMFRYDILRHERYLGGLAAHASRQGVEGHKYPIAPATLVATAARQTSATLGIIATELPIYQVDLQANNRRAILIGTVPALRH